MSTYQNLRNIQQLLLRRTSEVLAYTWEDNFCLKYLRETEWLIKNAEWFPKDGINIQALSLGEMKELGFGLWNNESQLRLIPLWMVPYLNGNTEVLSISGERCKLREVQVNRRFGCIAYGIVRIEKAESGQEN